MYVWMYEAKICIDNILQVVISLLSNDSLMDSCILLFYIKNMNRAHHMAKTWDKKQWKISFSIGNY